jgi:hypothetical protein
MYQSGNIPNNVGRSVQYGSNPTDSFVNKDRIAPQSRIKNVMENAYIPNNVPQGPLSSCQLW